MVVLSQNVCCHKNTLVRTYALIPFLMLTGCGSFNVFLEGNIETAASLGTISSISYSPSVRGLAISNSGTAIPSITPSVSSSGLISFSISPSLPSGLSIDPQTGVISGTPTASSPDAPNETTYTITATGSNGSINTSIDLVIMPGFVVNDSGDGGDDNLADSTCHAISGGCTLRAAIEEAQDEGGQRVITLPDGTYSIGSKLDITPGALTSIHISGESRSGTILDGGYAVGIMEAYFGAMDLSLTNLTFQRASTAGEGSALRFGSTPGNLRMENVYIYDNHNTAGSTGAIRIVGAAARLTMTNCRIEGNTSQLHAGAIGYLGADSGSSITDSEFINNSATASGGALWGGLDLLRTTFSGNSADDGGAYYIGNVTAGAFAIDQSSFISNTAGNGGALFLANSTVTVKNSLFRSNHATQLSGALVSSTASILTLENSTFFENTSDLSGGAIRVNDGTVTAQHLSIVNNNADNDGGGGNAGGIYVSSGSLSLSDSILSGNTANGVNENCTNLSTFTSNDYNVYDSAGGNCWADAGNDRGVASAGISSSLADNGGSTLTLSLSASSPAIDIRSTACTLSTDARGISRPDGACDAGAFER
tara:strand:- start:2403 stop:4187 length:1785 start_codon:yes stop_codon:yes gene_type:complete